MARDLHRRGNRFCIRRRVPVGLVAIIGRTHIVRSLGTSDYREAGKLAIKEAARIEHEFDQAEGRTVTGDGPFTRSLDDLSVREIDDVVFNWFRREAGQVEITYAVPEGEVHTSDTTMPDIANPDPGGEVQELNKSLARLQRAPEFALEAELGPVIANICRMKVWNTATPQMRASNCIRQPRLWRTGGVQNTEHSASLSGAAGRKF